MLPTDFSSWTKEQWIEFDNIRNILFETTQEEIDIQLVAAEQAKLDKTNTVLASVNMTLPEIVDRVFLLAFAEAIDAQQYVWNIDTRIDWQVALYGGDMRLALIEIIYTQHNC